MKLNFLLVLFILTISCNTNKKKPEISNDETFSAYAVLTVTEIKQGKDDYTATLKNNAGNFYTCVINISNIEDKYKNLKIGNKVKIIGDYGNGEPTPIIAKRIIIIEN